jgi:hypothetical protein
VRRLTFPKSTAQFETVGVVIAERDFLCQVLSFGLRRVLGRQLLFRLKEFSVDPAQRRFHFSYCPSSLSGNELRPKARLAGEKLLSSLREPKGT